tara:strand:- start:119607 stop:119900 length:294 start_codon:yes stop_codon:yes gene_type:complete
MRLSILLILAFCHGVAAGEPVVTLQSKVTGNQEQPRVLYLVPWQQPVDGDFDYAPQSDIAQSLFAPLDRDEFRRDLEYQSVLEGDGDSAPDEGTTGP